jgi:hypothetical protein
MEISPLLQILVSGLLALLGGYAGASLARRTEYEKWLRQEKSKAFAELLLQLHDTRLAASDAMYDMTVPEEERSIAANELYAKLRKYESVARLYMSAGGREQMKRYLSSIWLLATADGGPANKSIEIRQHMDGFQELLGACRAFPPTLCRRWLGQLLQFERAPNA